MLLLPNGWHGVKAWQYLSDRARYQNTVTNSASPERTVTTYFCSIVGSYNWCIKRFLYSGSKPSMIAFHPLVPMSRQKRLCVVTRKVLNRAHEEGSRLVHQGRFHHYDHPNLVFCDPNGALLRVPFMFQRFQPRRMMRSNSSWSYFLHKLL